MSEYERNKGRLIPVHEPVEEVAERIISELPRWYETKLECFRENAENFGYVLLGGQLYLIKWELQGGADAPEFCDVHQSEDGSISFHSYHYNGGAHWTEVVGSALAARTQEPQQ